jgi:hypothetical protein
MRDNDGVVVDVHNLAGRIGSLGDLMGVLSGGKSGPDVTIRNDTRHLDLIRELFGRPLWEMQPEDADAYFGRVLRDARP